MKRLLAVISFLVASVAAATEWYASNRTTTGGSGTISGPWDLYTALIQDSTVIKPGDNLTLRGGIYKGTGSSAWEVGLQGTADARITIRSSPGEWAVLDKYGLTFGLHFGNSPRAPTYVDLRDIEMYDSSPSRQPWFNELIRADTGL